MQLSSQIDEPDYAPLMDDMFFAQGGDIAASHFIAPRVEVELAFVLGQPLEGPNVTLVDVLRAADYVWCSTPSPTSRPTRASSWGAGR